MSRNFSSRDFPLHPNLSSFAFQLPLGMDCILFSPSSLIFFTYNLVTIFFLLPVCIFILSHGLQEWWQKSSTMSHSDCFTYHTVIVELIGTFGCILCSSGLYMDNLIVILAGGVLYSFIWSGETVFHVLTCVERYLAVVHPTTYLSLRTERGIRMRNFSIGCVWLFGFAGVATLMSDIVFNIVNFCLLVSSIIFSSFCSLSVLCVLIRPGPGKQGGNRERVVQSKKRAFYTIVAIMGVLVLRLASGMVRGVLYILKSTDCELITSVVWINLPCSLVSPLLFLHRAGKFKCCQKEKCIEVKARVA